MTVKDMGLILSTLLLGSVHQVCYRFAGQGFMLSPLLIIYGQSLGSLCLLSLWFKIQGSRPSWSLIASSHDRLFTLRALLALLGHLCFIEAIRVMPLLMVTLSSYLGISLTSLGAMVFLEKKISLRHGVALGLALIGMRWAHPLTHFSLASHYAVIATLCFSFSSLLTKALTQTHSPLQIVYELVLKMTLGSALVLVFQDPWALVFYGQAQYCFLFTGIAIVYLILHLIMTQSYQQSDLSLISLAKTLKVPLSGSVDFLIYGRAMGHHEYIGSMLIIGAILLHEGNLDIQRFLKKLTQLRVRTKALS